MSLRPRDVVVRQAMSGGPRCCRCRKVSMPVGTRLWAFCRGGAGAGVTFVIIMAAPQLQLQIKTSRT
jgi:hypothetical protein